MKLKHPANDNEIERARSLWQRRLGEPRTDIELRELSANLTGFFSILAEWGRNASPVNDNDEARTAGSEPEVP